MELTERVHFYTASDLSLGWQIPRINMLIGKRSSWFTFTDVNDVIELYETQKVIETGAVKYQEDDGIISDIKKTLNKYCSQIDSGNIQSVMEQVDISYKDDFWEMLASFGAYKRIDVKSFEMLMQNEAFDIINILHQKKLVSQFDSAIREYLINNIRCSRLLISKNLEKKERQVKEVFFPKSLTVQDRVDLLWRYIESPNIGINELELISKSRGDDQLPIAPEMKLSARRKYEERLKDFLESAPTMTFGASVVFKELSEGVIETHQLNEGVIQAEYSLNWIKDNLDNPTLLNNFIYLFGYTDRQFRWTQTSRKEGISIFEKLLGMKGRREYLTGAAFTTIQMLGNSQIYGYCNTLKRLGIDIEEVIRWFFTDYLFSEFNAQGFLFNKSSEGTNALEKCRNLVIEIDSILKQFILFCKHNEIDWQLFEINTEHMLVKNVPSLLKDKYLYPDGDEFNKAAYILFSDQSLAYYIKGKTDQYSSFYEALKNTSIKKEELKPYQLSEVNWLTGKGILVLGENNVLGFDKALLWVMHDLYLNECACTSYLRSYQDQLLFLKKKGMIRYGSTLLSEPEQHYYNYIFNAAEYDNSLDLRNKYVHGSHRPDNKTDQYNYYIILRMLILIIIKINEEFCLFEESKEKDEQAPSI